MTDKVGPRKAWIDQYGYRIIPNNEPNGDRPYTIHLSTRGASIGSVTASIIRTDGIRPKRISKGHRTRFRESCYVGKTDKCSFRRVIYALVEIRDYLNLIHGVRSRRVRITEADLKLPAPSKALKQELIEACCLAAL